MKTTTCVKCGKVLDANGPKYSGMTTEMAIKSMASDHASKNGCPWPGANLKVITKQMS